MNKWNLIIDVAKCEDCNNCFLACKDEHFDNNWPGYTFPQPLHGHRWINIMRKERGQYPLIDIAYLPILCMHCDNAPCLAAAKNEAVYKREDGIVIIDQEKASGQEAIMKACPNGAIWWNEEKNVPQKCTLCAHLLDDGWKQPRCVQACPTGALKIVRGDDLEIDQMITSGKLEILNPQHNASPRVYYKNLYRFEKCFVAGSVAFEKEGITDCAEGATVVLQKDGKVLAEAATDNFGDFRFDNLDENSGSYSTVITYRDYKKKVIEVNLTTSLNMGTILC